MDLKLEKSNFKNNQHIIISGSKSETNRLLLLQSFYPDLQIENSSNSDDSKVMAEVLSYSNTPSEINVHHAGTAMRFLTAYFAVQNYKEVVLTGSNRMKERPIGVLVDALNQLGATISYVEREGFPPLKIKGKQLLKNKVSINANVSSQYITALMLIGSSLPNGLEIQLKGELTSVPYIYMTLSILQSLGINAQFNENVIQVLPIKSLQNKKITVESDWSSASYFYSILALTPLNAEIKLSYFKQNSLQGDAVLAEIYKEFGVQTIFSNHQLILKKTTEPVVKNLKIDLNSAPDIAQTIVVTCLGLGITCHLTGLHTLKIKETDRLQALKNELEKFGAIIEITNESLQLKNTVHFSTNVVEIDTYNDHRMAMAFAPLALKQSLMVKNAEVVSKSFPNFWNDLKTVGFSQLPVS